jgi:hypothetical protein
MTTELVELQERNEALEAQLDHLVKTYTEKVVQLKMRVAELEGWIDRDEVEDYR